MAETEAKNTQAGQSGEQSEGINITDKRRVSADDPAPDDAAEGAAASQPSVTELLSKLKVSEAKREEAERQVRDFSERFRHAQVQLRAENDELRTRLQRNFEQKLESARGDMVAGLLDVLDNLKLAVAAASSQQGRGPEFDNLLGGVRVTAQMFEARMNSLGLTPIVSVGEVFNPEVHEAVELVACAPEQDGRVVEELQTGYKFGDRLLRPARVRVGRAGEL
ncbi:MAG: nucleotide exchange factor GrpE [Blastocatellia bacterium]